MWGKMKKSRSEALLSLVAEIEGFDLNLNHYYDDAGPQSIIDSHLGGKLEALANYCRAFGWSELARTIEEQLPLRCSAQEALSVIQGFVIPEIRYIMEKVDVDSEPAQTDWFWDFVHPRIKALAQPRFEAGFLGDAVEASFKEVNDSIKRLFVESEGREADGAGLMNTAFSPNNPIIRLANLDSETGRNIQQGYMQILAGAMTGIRNPKAHGNLNPDPKKALHLIALASLLMCKIDERI